MKMIDIVFVYEEILKQITPLRRHRYFIRDYQLINYKLSKYYIRKMRHLNKGLRYLWRYIESRMEGFVLQENDYQIMNMFVEYLMISNSFRRAILFMKKYIFMIPPIYLATRKKAFCLMSKAQTEIGGKMAKIYSQLIEDDCKMLMTKNLSILFGKENREQHRKKIL